MTISAILSNYENFKEQTITNRFFKHNEVTALLGKLPSSFNVSILGKSVNGQDINLVKWGYGKTKIMIWSQMHGDEATGTMALFDLFNFLQGENDLVKELAQDCELYAIPMVNPDGASNFTRRNAQQIDINRDFLKEATPEGKILKYCFTSLKPDFGFNLHDQTTLWSVAKTLKPATLSFLAPAFDEGLSINEMRKNSMLIIADMFKHLSPLLPNQIGLFDDEFEPRAFGDNFQKAGTSTILIEAGGYEDDDEKQEIRKYYFGAILSGLTSIVTRSYQSQTTESYFKIPKNTKEVFHILVQNISIQGMTTSIGLNYEEHVALGSHIPIRTYSVADIGDLSFSGGYQIYSSSLLKINGEVLLSQQANFQLLDGDKLIFSFQNGILA